MADPQTYDDNGKPIGGGVVTYDDNGKPISAAPPSAPHTGGDYYWQAFKDFGEGLKTSGAKTLDALNPFSPSPARETRGQEAARIEAQLKNAPPLNFDPSVTGRAIWKGVRNITAKDVGEGVGDIGQMYLAGKAAGAVEPETVRGVINTTGRGIDAVGRGTTAVGDATMSATTPAAIYGAMAKSPGAAALAVVPPMLKYGGKGISALGRAMQSEPPPTAKYTPSSGLPDPNYVPPVEPPDEGSPFAKYTPSSSDVEQGPHNTPGGGESGPPPRPQTTGTGSPATSGEPVFWNQYTAPATPPPAPPPPGYRPTGTGADVPQPRPAGTEPWTAEGSPPSQEPIRTGTGSDVEPPGGAGTAPWTAPQPPAPPPGFTPTGTGSTATPPSGAGTEPWTVPVPETVVVPPATGTQNTPAGKMPVSWDQFTTRPASPAAAETPAAAAAPAGEGTDTAMNALREQLEASLRKAAEKGTAGAEEPPAEAESTIPSKEQMSADELSRARKGARDSPDRQEGESVEDYRLRTRGRATGETSEEPSIIPSERSAAIDDKIESMYARNATDQEFRDYLAKSKNHPKKDEIAAKIESKAHSWKRASPLAHVLAGAAIGATLRQALVNQLQGDRKDEQQ